MIKRECTYNKNWKKVILIWSLYPIFGDNGLAYAVGKSSRKIVASLQFSMVMMMSVFYPSSTTRLKHFGLSRWLRKLLSPKTSVYFKREWTNKTNQWPYTCCIKPLSFSILKKNHKSSIHKSRLLPSHIVDKEVADLVGSTTGYAFSTESLTTTKSGRIKVWDHNKTWRLGMSRHYEIAASGTIPCFKDLTSKPESCAPHGLVDGVNCISYTTTQDLMEQINQLSRPAELAMREAALDWAKASSTKLRAIELLKAMKIDRES